MWAHRHKPQSSRAQRWLLGLLVTAFLASTVLFAVTAAEALEERRSAVSAADARLAVLSIAPVTNASGMANAEYLHFEESVGFLEGDLSDALHGLSPSLRAATAEGIRHIADHGRRVLDGSVDLEAAPMVDYQDLQLALRTASVDAAADAAQSERSSGILGFVAVLLLAAIAGIVIKSRDRVLSIAAAAKAYEDAADRLGRVLDRSRDATAVITADGTISYASAALRELLGPSPRHTDDIMALAHPSQRARLLAHLGAGGARWAELDLTSPLVDSISASREFRYAVTDLRDDPLVNGHLVSISETTVDNRARRDLRHMATHCLLTGLPNRSQLMNDLCDDVGLSLILVDLDNFGETNDTLGQDAGDELLNVVARRFEACLGDKDTIYGLGGDEFAVLSRRSFDDAQSLSQALLAALDSPVELAAGYERAGASIGLAPASDSSRLPLLRRAGIALSEAKRLGGGQVVVSSVGLDRQAVLRSHLSRSFQKADLDAEFYLEFQPIVGTSGSIRYFEALARWTSPTHGKVRTDLFIPIAEASGRIKELGYWVLDNALETLSTWRSNGVAPGVGVTVNVSPFQLEDPHFVNHTRSLLALHDVEPQSLTLELTESALASAIDSLVDKLVALRELGCVIACDDFGSGYSNLGQLMMLPLDIVKVDRQLMVRLDEMEQSRGSDGELGQVMGAIVAIGNAMNAEIIAEGVESGQQAESIVASGVHMLQGYHYGRPVGAVEAGEILAQNVPLPTDQTAVSPTSQRPELARVVSE